MPGDDRVGVLTADGDAGLGQHCRAVCQIVVVGPEVDRHLQIHGRNTQDPENLIRKAVVRHRNRDNLGGYPIGQVPLANRHQPFVIGLDRTIEFLVWHWFFGLHRGLLNLLDAPAELFDVMPDLPRPFGFVYQGIERKRGGGHGSGDQDNHPEKLPCEFTFFHGHLSFFHDHQ